MRLDDVFGGLEWIDIFYGICDRIDIYRTNMYVAGTEICWCWYTSSEIAILLAKIV